MGKHAKGPVLRTYEVCYPMGPETIREKVQAHYAFDNRSQNEGLIFRRYVNDDTESKTYVVAAYADYIYFKEVPNNE
jgi:hypothetical protein